MAKKPAKSNLSPRASQRGQGMSDSRSLESPTGEAEATPRSPAPAELSELDELEAGLSVSGAELDALENRLSAGLAAAPADTSEARAPLVDVALESGMGPAETTVPPEAVGAPAAEAPDPPTSSRDAASDDTPVAVGAEDDPITHGTSAGGAGRPRPAAGRGFGATEWAALGGFGLLALVGGILFVKFLYAHPAPTQGEGLPTAFVLPLSGPMVHLSDAEAGWRERLESDKARAEEVVLPSITLTLDAGHTSTGFIRVEFVDPDDKIRGDILTVGIEGGRFKDSGRGEIIEDGGLKARLTGTFGFRSHALFTSYISGQESRWSVRVKEGVDSSNGPWTILGISLIPHTKQ